MLGPGSILAERFRLLAPLGEGGMAIVWRARDELLGADVAVKLLRPLLARDPTARARFRAEATNTRRARNDHVVDVHELILEHDPPFFVMPALTGCTLRDRIRATGGLAFAEAERILTDVLRGLSAAHDAGIVHRDIKPHNVFLDRDTGRAVLLDFGIAFDDQREVALTHTGMIVGTPAYMAPEVVAGDAEADAPAADVYAAGLLAYEMIVGALPPLDRSPPHLHETRRGREAGVTVAFGDAIARALSHDPADRPATARALLDTLDAGGELAVGELVDGRYRIEALAGAGGMAMVYRAQDTRLGERVAVKVVAGDDDEVLGRFRDECEILMRLTGAHAGHAHIVDVRAVGMHRGRPYCALELVDGPTLGEAAGELGWAGVVRAIEQVAAALDDVHVAGVVHRDIKADNILVRPNGDAVLIDFGVARMGGAWRTRTGVIVGTPGAEAPEQAAGGHVSGLTDQWALAAVCYGLLAGRVPGEAIDAGDSQERALQTVENVIDGDVVSLGVLRPDLPPALCEAVMRALAGEPADRFRSATAFATAVRRASAGARLPGEATPRSSGRRAYVAAAVISVAFAAAVAAAIVWADRAPQSPAPGRAAESDQDRTAPEREASTPAAAPRPPSESVSPAPAPAVPSTAPPAAPRRRPAPVSTPLPGFPVDPAALMRDTERMAEEMERDMRRFETEHSVEAEPAMAWPEPDFDSDWAEDDDGGDHGM